MAQDAALLNALTATLLDSIAGYQKAAGDAADTRLADTFNARARERRWAVTKLQAAVALEGGTPESEGTLLAGAHRAFLSFREASGPRDDKAIVQEIESGEDYLKERFETALARGDLSETARRAIDEAWQSVRAGHDAMAALKHAMEA